MSFRWPKDGPNSAPSYIISGIPYLTQSSGHSGGEVPRADGGSPDTLKHELPYATKFFEVENIHGSRTLRVGFSALGVKGTVSSHYFTVAAGAKSEIYYLRCKELYFGGEGGSSDFKLVAGLTNIPASNFPILTGSVTGSSVGSAIANFPINTGVG